MCRCPWRLEEGARFPGVSYPLWCWKLNLGSLLE